jgi:hypothetical protein
LVVIVIVDEDGIYDPRQYMRPLLIRQVARMVENGLHWVLDMTFRDDECRVRTDNAPFNLAIVKHIALNVLRTGKSKDSLRMRRKVAAWDDNALAAYIAA